MSTSTNKSQKDPEIPPAPQAYTQNKPKEEGEEVDDHVDTSKIRFRWKYFITFPGLFRIGIILCQFCVWIGAAVVQKYNNVELHTELKPTRDATLFFGLSGFVISIAIFVLYVFNIPKIKFLFSFIMTLIVIVTDILWGLAALALAVVCAYREEQLNKEYYYYRSVLNVGSFGEAAAFGFVAALLYLINALYWIILLINGEEID